MAKGLKNVILVAIAGLIALVVLLLIVGTAVSYGSARGGLSVEASVPILMGGFALILMVGAFWIGALWMRTIDEAAREAHKWAWYWGGTAGMAVGGVLTLMVTAPRETPVQIPLILGNTPDPAGYAATGAFGLMMLMALGYVIAWAVWWLRHR